MARPQWAAQEWPVGLRPVRPADVERFLQWAQDPELRRHFLGGSGADRTTDWVPAAVHRRGAGPIGTSRTAGQIVRAVETRDGLLLGWIELRDLNWRRRTGELRICLGDPATWGRGYGTAAISLFLHQAFEVWSLERIHLRVATWNVRAVRAYERCGFRREAALRAGRRAADGQEDLWLMSAEAGPRAAVAQGR